MHFLINYYYNTINYYSFKQCLSFWISLAFNLKSRVHGISSPPWGRSAEYLLPPVTVQFIEPPLLKNREQTFDIFLGRCPMMVPSFSTVTAYLSVALVGSLLHTSSSPIA